MATPSRVEDWFQLVPHLVWEEGAGPPAGTNCCLGIMVEVISVSNVQVQNAGDGAGDLYVLNRFGLSI